MRDDKLSLVRQSHVQVQIAGRSDAMWGRDLPVHIAMPQSGSVIPGCSNRLALKMVLSGELYYQFDRKRYVVHPGQILVLPPNLRHVTTFTPTATVLIAYLSEATLLECSRTADELRDGLDEPPEALFDFPPHIRLDQLNVASALQTYAKCADNFAREEVRATVIKLAARFVFDARSAARRISASRASARNELFRRVCIARSNIELDPFLSSSLVALASSAALSPFHLLRTFSQAFGETPARMRRRLLIDHAKSLLCSTDWSIGRIASSVGFESHAAFCRAFRRNTGHAPTTYRSRALRRSNDRVCT